MEDFIRVLEENFNLCSKLNDQLQSLLGIDSEAMPIAGLNMAHQKAVGAYEPAIFYYQAWGIPVPVTPAQHARQMEDNGLRLMGLARAAFIETMSAFEFCLKETVKNHPGVITLDPKRRVHLYGIMLASHAAGLISEQDLKFWDGLRELRNALVHNNAIADIDATYEFHDETVGDEVGELSIIMVKGETQRSKLTKMPLLCRWAIHAYARWCVAYLRK